ncbi:MAG: hydrogenase 3 maturation endopeptidase HyCI [Planctomycetota bacterium]|jgi:hydrogenase 3 maturation protease
MATDQQLFERLSALRGSRTLIVGIGNTLKGDDGAGPLVCDRLREADISAEIIDTATVPENYIQPIVERAPRNLIIIDAVDFGGSPGAINIFKPEQLNSFAFSTHTLSPRLFVDMVRNQIEVQVYFVGIQPDNIRLGQPLSLPVSRAIECVSKVLAEVFAAEK